MPISLTLGTGFDILAGLVLNIDTSGTPFGSAPTWTDRTSYLITGRDGEPVQITRYRQDEQSDVQPATCSFLLDNTTGFWTPGNAAAPAAWDVGCPVNVQITFNSVTYNRFTGLVDSIEPTWPGGVQSWSVVKVSCTDITARLGLAQPLRSMLEHEILADSPTFLYPLTEAGGASSGGDVVSSSNPTITRVDSPYGGTGALFGADTGLFEGQTGVDFRGAWALIPGTPTERNSVLSVCSGRTTGPFVSSTGAWSVEIWTVPPASAPGSSYESPTIVGQTDGRLDGTEAGFLINLDPVTGQVLVNVQDAGTSPAFAQVLNSVTNVCDSLLHQIVLTMNAARTVTSLYVDGVLEAQSTSGVGAASWTLRYNLLGGLVTNYGSAGRYPGTVAYYAQFPSELSAARVLSHYQVGTGTNIERSDLRFARIAGYGGITTTGLPTGRAIMGGQTIVGRTAIEVLNDIARTEGTAAFATGAGVLTFQARDFRYYQAIGLTLAADDLNVDFSPRRDRQGQFNEITVTRSGGASQTVVDAARRSADGRRDGGSFEVSSSTDDDAYQAAAWRIANHKAPVTRVPSLAINMLAQSNNTTVANLLSADFGTVVRATGLPSQAPASTLDQRVEGVTETIGVQDWTLSFFTSPVMPLENSVFVLDSGSRGILDTNVLAF